MFIAVHVSRCSVPSWSILICFSLTLEGVLICFSLPFFGIIEFLLLNLFPVYYTLSLCPNIYSKVPGENVKEDKMNLQGIPQESFFAPSQHCLFSFTSGVFFIPHTVSLLIVIFFSLTGSSPMRHVGNLMLY